MAYTISTPTPYIYAVTLSGFEGMGRDLTFFAVMFRIHAFALVSGINHAIPI